MKVRELKEPFQSLCSSVSTKCLEYHLSVLLPHLIVTTNSIALHSLILTPTSVQGGKLCTLNPIYRTVEPQK
jgi:hypothetical protein